MMKNKNYLSPNRTKWFQLGFSLLLALFLFLIPIAVGRRISLGPSFQAVDLSLGAALVHATGGLTITKSAPASVAQGQAITYTLRITNNTGQDLTDGAIADTLPNDVNPASCQEIQSPANWTFLCDGGAAVWAFIDGFSQPIPDGGVVTLRFRVNTNSPLTSGHAIVNDDYQISAGTFSDAGPAVTTTILAPAWAITKTVSSPTIQPGQNLVYTIIATNIGQVSTSGAYTISDTLPNATTLVTPASLNWSFTAPLAPLQSRTVSFTVKANSPLANGLKIVNDGYTVSGGGATGSAVNAPITVTVISTSTMSISKVASANPVQVGNTLRYTITLTNNAATGSADGVIITDTLPPSVTFRSATAGGIHTNGVVVWTLGSIPPVSSTQVTVVVTAPTTLPSPAQLINNYEATADNANPVIGSLTTGVKPGPPDALSLVVTPSSIPICGTGVATATVRDEFDNPLSGVPVTMLYSPQVVTLTLESGVTNAAGNFVMQFRGRAPSSALVNIAALVSGLPANITSISVTSPAIPSSLSLSAAPNPLVTGGNPAVVTATLLDCDDDPVAGQTIDFSLSNPALATFSGPISGTTDADGVVTTTLTSNSTPLAGSLTITGTSGSLVGVTSLNVLEPNTPLLTLTKIASPTTGSTIETGATLLYTVTVANIGTGAATGVVLTDDLPAGVNFVGGHISGGTGPFVTGDIVNFAIANLGLNSSRTATITVTVTSAISGTTLRNRASAKSATTSLITTNPIVTHTVTTSTLTTDNKIYLPVIFNQ